MKYIRTKDGIFDNRLMDGVMPERISAQSFGIEAIKYADTIEELCDEYVVKVNIHNAVLHDLDSALRFVAGYDHHELTKNYEIYGAIWTEKGLIYVAKMNEKGELELL